MLHSVAINPRSWLCYNNLGVVYEAEHDWQSALDAYQRSIRVREHPTIYNNLGAVYMNLQRPADALDVFRRAMVFRPHDALLLNNVGVAWLTMGKLDNAQVSFEEALVQQPDLTQARDNLHRLHQIRQGKRPSLTAGGMLG